MSNEKKAAHRPAALCTSDCDACEREIKSPDPVDECIHKYARELEHRVAKMMGLLAPRSKKEYLPVPSQSTNPTNKCKICNAKHATPVELWQHLCASHSQNMDATIKKHFPDLFTDDGICERCGKIVTDHLTQDSGVFVCDDCLKKDAHALPTCDECKHAVGIPVDTPCPESPRCKVIIRSIDEGSSCSNFSKKEPSTLASANRSNYHANANANPNNFKKTNVPPPKKTIEERYEMIIQSIVNDKRVRYCVWCGDVYPDGQERCQCGVLSSEKTSILVVDQKKINRNQTKKE